MKKLVGVLSLFLLCSVFPTTVMHSSHSGGDDTYNSCITYIPGAISPNGDGINDAFQVRHKCDIADFSIRIYTENSVLVHEIRSVEGSWDGSFNGQPLPQGRYNWVMRYASDSGMQMSKRGEVLLIR